MSINSLQCVNKDIMYFTHFKVLANSAHLVLVLRHMLGFGGD
jgi:hypothetical protein